MKIRHIDSSPMLCNSSSRKLSLALTKAICQRFPNASVTYRDLGRTPPPHLREETFLVLGGKLMSTDAQTQSEVEGIRNAIAELSLCDILVIGAPMINHSVSSGLKTWIDQVCQAGLTFRFTSTGATGLLADRPAFIVSTRGGIYSDTRHRELDHQESYLRSTLNLMGITNVHILPTEGVDKTIPGRSLAEKNSLAQIPCMLAHAFNR